jgi:hypothetical protein
MQHSPFYGRGCFLLDIMPIGLREGGKMFSGLSFRESRTFG